jgi:hypothetical protein
MSCDGLNLLKPDSDADFRWLDVLLDRVKQCSATNMSASPLMTRARAGIPKL